jgi:putative transposase
LGKDAEEQQAAYRELFRHELDPGMVDAIRRATNGNIVLGRPRFSADVANALGRRVTLGVPGRPKKIADPESGSLFE